MLGSREGNGKMHIVCLEDELATRQALKQYLERYAAQHQLEFAIQFYTAGEELLRQYHPGWDLVLLDIRLPGMTGMEVARALRRVDQNIPLMFITSLAHYALQSYEVNALDFLLKPVTYPELSMKLDKAVRVIRSRSGCRLPVGTRDGLHVLFSGDITYIEVQNHDRYYHTEQEVYQDRGSLSRLEEQLAPFHFVRISVCYLVNLNYVEALRGSALALRTGEQLAISRSKRHAVLTALADFLGGTR